MNENLTVAQNCIIGVYLTLRKHMSVADIKVTKLCERAKVAHSTFYKYYKDVYDLNRHVEQVAFTALLAKVGQEKDDKARREMMCRELIKYSKEYFSLYNLQERYIFYENIRTFMKRINANIEEINGDIYVMQSFTSGITVVLLAIEDLSPINHGEFSAEDVKYLMQMQSSTVNIGESRLTDLNEYKKSEWHDKEINSFYHYIVKQLQ